MVKITDYDGIEKEYVIRELNPLNRAKLFGIIDMSAYNKYTVSQQYKEDVDKDEVKDITDFLKPEYNMFDFLNKAFEYSVVGNIDLNNIPSSEFDRVVVEVKKLIFGNKPKN